MTFDPNSKIGRWIGWFVVPLATIAATTIAVKAKAWFGIELNTAEVLTFVLGVVSGFITWLYNRGKYEAAHVLKTTPTAVEERLHDLEALLPSPPATAAGKGAPASPRAPGGGISPVGDGDELPPG